MSDIQFFDFAAQAGLTKHFGELEATEELIQHCQITENTHILDVGCGVGQTPVYIAKTVGARVTGIDINPGMIKRSKERAQKQGVTSLTEFREADAQDLPFPDNTFDAVITESVTAFPEDKQRAVNEYARVTKPGGMVLIRTPNNEALGSLVLEDLPPAPRGETRIEVTFRVDTDGILHVRARDQKTGQAQEAKLNVIGAPVQEESEHRSVISEMFALDDIKPEPES